AKAKDDLLVVYDYLNLLPHDITLVYPAEFGQNLVLTPHTYRMDGAVTFTGTLFLNAEGNPNAVFVIKTYGAFGTSVNAEVVLTNGAQAKNVFWLVEGALSMATDATMKGTFIVNNGAITLNTNVNLEGRALTTDGALLTDAITANATDLPSDCKISPLPVELISFKGTANENSQVVLTWTTASESNSAHFTIERSENGVKFGALGKVNAAGNANSLKHYTYSDNDVPGGMVYYRLKQTDLDDTFVYSKIISSGNFKKGIELASVVNIFPNPVTAATVINLNDASRLNPSELAIYNVLGTLMVKMNLTEKTTPLKTDLPTGVYFYQITGKNNSVQTGKLISQQ
ncbi:MAG TPA: ice-binding family protein, partial [Adhaeribacter sp.]|nr:ice-binding family protein [Adhaeribacter sp.]